MDDIEYQEQEDLQEYERYLNMMNIYMMYYNKLHSCNLKLFDNINDTKPFSTNRQMEILYEHIYEIKQEKNPDNMLVKPIGSYDINNFNNMFLLEYDNIQVQSPYLVSLLYYIIDEKISEKEWSIVSLK